MNSHSLNARVSATACMVILGTTLSAHSTDFSWSPTSPEIGESVSFNISGHTGGIVAEWDFGGSGCSVYPQDFVCEPGITECLSAAHKFNSSGSKTVTLTVRDPINGDVIGGATHPLTVQNVGECYSGDPEEYSCGDGDVHDDGSAENGYGWSVADAIVEKFTPSTYPTTYTEVCVGWTRAGIDDTIDYEVVFFDDDGPGGSPGTQIAAIDSTGDGIPGWLDVAFTRTHVTGLVPAISEGSIYVGVIWDGNTDSAFYVASDESISTDQQTAYLSQDGISWSPVIDHYPLYRALLVRPGTGTGPVSTPWEIVVGGIYGGGNGFGDSSLQYSRDMEVFNNQLYLGGLRVWGPEGEQAEIWRTSNGIDWVPAITPGFGDEDLDGLHAIEVFGSALYVGDDWGRIWRTTNGTEWDQADGGVLQASGNGAVLSLTEFNGFLYAGTGDNFDLLCEVWRSPDGTSWSQVQDSGFGVDNNQGVVDMLEFQEMLYAATDKGIWRTSDGIAWFPVLTAYNILQLAKFNNHLFTFGRYDGEWWSADGQNWTLVPGPLLGSYYNVYAYPFTVTESSIIAGTYAPDQGGQVWLSQNGHQWDQINKNGFGNPENWGAVEIAIFQNYLYVGTVNPQGLEVWRLSDVMDSEIFSDGFESGDKTAWSSSVP